MEGARAPGTKMGTRRKVAEKASKYKIDVPEGKSVFEQIAALEKQMFDAAKDLEFEKAAQIRDQIAQLKNEI